MVRVLVRDEDAVEVVLAFPNGGEAGGDLLAAESGIDQKARPGGGDEGRVAGTAAGEDADLDDSRSLKRKSRTEGEAVSTALRLSSDRYLSRLAACAMGISGRWKRGASRDATGARRLHTDPDMHGIARDHRDSRARDRSRPDLYCAE